MSFSIYLVYNGDTHRSKGSGAFISTEDFIASRMRGLKATSLNRDGVIIL